MDEQAPTIHTIGHSNHTLEAFLALLAEARIDLLLDVRSSPRSGYATHFDRDALAPALAQAGIDYEWVGRALGGRPTSDLYYDDDGHVRYDEIARTQAFGAGIAAVLARLAERRAALMCGEEDPAECHRRLLVGRVLGDRGVAVVHLRGDGRVQTEAELAHAADLARDGGQLSLFDEEEVPQPWRSTRSASHRSPRSSSSTHS